MFLRKLIRGLPRCSVASRKGFSAVADCALDDCADRAPVEGRKGLVLGCYEADEGVKLSDDAMAFDERTGGKICEFVKSLTTPITLGQSVVFTNLVEDFFNVCLVGIGSDTAGFNSSEDLDECKENVRVAAGVGVRRLRNNGVTCILVDGMSNAEAAAEGAQLAVWRFQKYKNELNQVPIATVNLQGGDSMQDEWERGRMKAQAQNLARELSDSPANCMTPTIFVERVGGLLCGCGVQVEVRDRDWLETKELHGFLTAAKGSCELPALMELSYCGGGSDDKPVLLVGDGCCYNCGGISLWTEEKLDEWKADMTGAAVVTAILWSAAKLGLPMNLRAVIPLYENMISGMAVKPGDVVHTMAGKTIIVPDTGVVSFLAVADAMTYGQKEFKPQLVVDVGSMSRGVRSAFGAGATGTFTNCDSIWREVQKAGSITGDRVWRMPLWDHYTRRVTKYLESDIRGNRLTCHGSACLAAAVLKEFIICNDWLHLDTTGTGMISRAEELPYLPRGRMTGRPTRTLIQFLYQLACGEADEAN